MAHLMRALMKECGSVAVRKVPQPVLKAPDQVVIRIALAGLCRTDMYVAEGKIKAFDPLILGHEFSGEIESIGSNVKELKVGDRVTVNPVIPCMKCEQCRNNSSSRCQFYEFIGIDRNGCFADFIVVPERAVKRLPESISFLAAAYAEPVAASLAVLKTGILPEQKGLIFGRNRFSQLVEKILRLKGFNKLDVVNPNAKDALDPSSYDFAIETMISTETVRQMVDAVKPGGAIILKSRQHEPVALKMTEIIRKEPVMHVVNYGSFDEAIDLLSAGKLDVEDLVDGVYKLENYQQVLQRARSSESLKPFFAPSG